MCNTAIISHALGYSQHHFNHITHQPILHFVASEDAVFEGFAFGLVGEGDFRVGRGVGDGPVAIGHDAILNEIGGPDWNMFQLNPKRRRSGMDRRNLGSMDGMDWWHPCNLDSGDPCRNDGIAEASSRSATRYLPIATFGAW